MRRVIRVLAAASVGGLLAGCGTPPAAAPKPSGPEIVQISKVINGGLEPISRSGSMTLALTGAGVRDVVRYTYSLTAPSSIAVQDPKGRTLLSLQNVEGVGAVIFKGKHPPLLLVTSSTVGNFGYPLTAYIYSASARRMEPVPFSQPASPTALFSYVKKSFSPLLGRAGASTSLLGFTLMTTSGLSVSQNVPQISMPFPSNYTLASHWVFTEPPATGWWILEKSAFGPNAAPRGVGYPKTAVSTAEEYLTGLVLGLGRYSAALAAPTAGSAYAKYLGLMQQPGLGTPLPAFDESAFNATQVEAGHPGSLTMYVWSGSGIGLKLSAFTASVGLHQSAQGTWQVTSLKLAPLAVAYPTPAGILGLLLGQPTITEFLKAHPGAQVSIGVQSDRAFYAAFSYAGAPSSAVTPMYTVDAFTGSVVYQGY